MKKNLTIASAFMLCVSSVFGITGRWVMEQNDKLPSSKTTVQESVLGIQKGDSKVIKKFRSVSIKDGNKTRTKMTFTYPTKMGFLVHDEKGKDSIQWIKLTSGKVRQIASSDKGKPWMNSHFYNEDIGDKDINNYEYEYLGEGKVGGHPVYKVEAVKNRGKKVYSKAIFYVDKKNFLQRQVDFYQRGRLIKTLYFENYEKIKGIWTPKKLKMVRVDGTGKNISLLYVKKVDHNVKVNSNKLKKENF